MFPIGDDNTTRTVTPYVNYILIGINILVFALFQKFGADELFTLSYSTVPAEILTGQDVVTQGLQVTPIPVYGTLFTAMFMHGSIMHIAGNMLYLWIFGDNLENVMGHFKYLLFYLICGVVASLAHVFTSQALGQNLLIPSLGASGAISGVMGGYLLLFPKNAVRVLMLRTVVSVSAYIALGIWILMQVVSSMSMFGGEGKEGGVAYAAHIGGFIAGLILVKLFATRKEKVTAQRLL